MTERDITPREAVPLAPFSTLGVGGAARWFVHAGSAADVAAAHRWCAARGTPMFVLGGGSNLVVADEGFDGLVLQVGLRGIEVRREGEDTLVCAPAGEPWDPLVGSIVSRGLAGVECLSGIPGSVGGTPIQNVGAYGQDVAATIEHVTAFDRTTTGIVTLRAVDCRFAYRTSRFKAEDAGRFVVCDVTFRLRPGPPTVTYPDVRRYLDARGAASPTVADVRDAVLAIRRGKGMVIDPRDPDTRSVGSFFMNPVVTPEHRERIASAAGAPLPGFPVRAGQVKIPAAWLIERAGFGKGYADDAVGLSSRHPLAIVNRGGATARDVLRLASRITRAVVERFDVRLRPEPVFVGFGADPDVQFLQNAEG